MDDIVSQMEKILSDELGKSIDAQIMKNLFDLDPIVVRKRKLKKLLEKFNI